MDRRWRRRSWGPRPAPCAPLNPEYGEPEFAFYLEDLRARALIVGEEGGTAAASAARARGLPVLRLAADDRSGEHVGRPVFGEGWPEARRPRWAGAGDEALVLHTSGTTAKPKQVPLTHANLAASARNVATALALTRVRPLPERDAALPHPRAGRGAARLPGGGGSVACCPGFTRRDFFGWLDGCDPPGTRPCRRYTRRSWPRRVQNLHVIAATSAPIHPLVVGGAAAAGDGRAGSGVRRAGDRGLRDDRGGPPDRLRTRCRPGRRSPGRSAAGRSRDRDHGRRGRLLPPGQPGEIVIRGPNVTTATRTTRRPTRGLHTTAGSGPATRGAGRGRVSYVTGRLKEIINRGGEKIAPREVDDVLLAHPAIAQAVTFAAPHPSLGEEVAAAVVLRPGAAVTDAELRRFATGRLAYFKVPSRIVVLDEIPKGPTGKPRHVGLAQILGFEGKGDQAGRPAAGGASPTPPRDELEEALVAVWAEVLCIEAGMIGIDRGLLELGGDSLAATRLLNRVRDAVGIEVPLDAFFIEPTVAGLAELLRLTPTGAAGVRKTEHAGIDVIFTRRGPRDGPTNPSDFAPGRYRGGAISRPLGVARRPARAGPTAIGAGRGIGGRRGRSEPRAGTVLGRAGMALAAPSPGPLRGGRTQANSLPSRWPARRRRADKMPDRPGGAA